LNFRILAVVRQVLAVAGLPPLSEPRRYRDKEHLKFIATLACLICGRQPSDPHHLRFAQHRALGRKVSDEFMVLICRGHHREVHRSSDEVAWWARYRIDAGEVARKLGPVPMIPPAIPDPISAAIQALSISVSE